MLEAGGASGEPVLLVEGLRFRYGAVEAVRGLDFAVHAGETFGLLGPNGAGKTTTLSILSTRLPASGGDARLFGQSLTAEARKVAPTTSHARPESTPPPAGDGGAAEGAVGG